MPKSSLGHSIAVASRLSGVPIETLRAWERRYGFPRPARVEGTKRRLYTEADIARLRAITRALAQGFRAGDVVPRRPAELEELIGRVEGSPTTASTTTSSSASLLPSVSELVAWLVADDVSAFDVELRRLAGALGPKAFVTTIAHPLAIEVGRAWEAGTLEVRQEHYASEALSTQLRTILGGLQDVPGAPTVVLATLPDELHGLGLGMVAVYLAISGAKPRIVGPNTPVDQIADAARAMRADVVGLTITPASIGPDLERRVRALEQALPGGVRLWLGGSGAREVASGRTREVVDDWLALDAAVERARARRSDHGGLRRGESR